MSLSRPIASLTAALLVRSGNAVMAGWTMPQAEPLASAPLASAAGPRQWPEGFRLAEKGKARPSIMTPDDEAASPFDAEIRISFRVDAERHRRLGLVTLRQGRSRQQLLVAALDAYLASGAAMVNAGNS